MRALTNSARGMPRDGSKGCWACHADEMATARTSSHQSLKDQFGGVRQERARIEPHLKPAATSFPIDATISFKLEETETLRVLLAVFSSDIEPPIRCHLAQHRI